MRLSTLLLAPALLAAGCLTPDDPVDAASVDASAAPDAAFLPWHSEGRYFVKPSQGSGLSTSELPFLVNGTGRVAKAVVTIGERYGPVELPRSTAYLHVQLVGADGKVAGEARRMPAGEPTLTLEAKDLPEGEATLVVNVGGGSDEKANGDYVTYVIDVE